MLGSLTLEPRATCVVTASHSPSSIYQLGNLVDVVLGDGRALTAVGRGKVELDMVLPNGKVKSCTLCDVLYVPELSYNQISVAKASQTGKIVKFTKSACYMLDKSHKMVAKATRVGGLYQLDYNPNQERASFAEQSDTKEDVWHKRFGHLGVSSLQRLAREKLVDDFDFDGSKQLTFCETCPQAKQSRTKFTTSSTRMAEPLDLVHSNVCGKMNVKPCGGAEYFLTFIDDKTRFVWVYFLHTKDQVFEKFCKWKSMVEKSSGKKLKVIRTDNGEEFTSKEFEAFLAKEGVRHKLIIPKNPEQNGVAERMNRTLVETTRSMLVNSNLPHSFWAEALSTATYLRNRSPTKAVTGMTPHEGWTREKPRVDGLRVFGCQAFVHIPKDERKNWTPSLRSFFVGYGTTTKGYRLYDPLRKKIIHSRDIIFNEQKYGFDETSESLKEPEQPVYLEYSDEPSETADAPTPPLRRSECERRQPIFYGYQCNLTHANEPKSVGDALNSPEWFDAMEAEIDSLHDHDIWELVELPEGQKLVGSKWVFKVKRNADGSIERCKARLVA